MSVTRHLPTEDVVFLDNIATAMGRDESYIIKTAVEDYIASQRWQIEQVRGSITQADAGQFATDDDVRSAFDELRT